MHYKLLGKSGLRVSELCLGTMTFGKDWEWGSTYEESRRVFDVFAEAGGNFLDTANLYTNGTSEKYVGEFIANDREKWVIATKYSLNNQSSDVNKSGNHRKNMRQSLEGSLKRLKTDYVDLLWVHAWDYTTPIEEVMRSFDDLVSAGKVLYIGVSDTPAWVVSAANTLAGLRGWPSFAALQIEYSLKERTPERDLLPMAKHYEMTVTPWAPLGAGLLTGKYNSNNPVQGRLAEKAATSKFSEKELKIAETVLKISKETGHSPAQVALNWLRQQYKKIIPIIGARNEEQLKDNLGCLAFTLTNAQINALNEVSAISLGFPFDFLNGAGVQDFAFSGSLKLIEKQL